MNEKRKFLSSYLGKRDGPHGITVYAVYTDENGSILEEIKPCEDIAGQMPPAFNWGYACTAAADLSKHILLHYFDVLDAETAEGAKAERWIAMVLSGAFRYTFVDAFPDRWQLDVETIDAWMDRPEIRRRVKELFGIQLYSERAKEEE